MGIAEAGTIASTTVKTEAGPVATFHSESDESKGEQPNDVIHSRIEKRQRLRGAARGFVCCLRRFSPVNILKRARDCYVASLGGCASNYSTYQPYGLGLVSCNSSPLPASLRMMREEYLGSESSLSPAFKKSFNESLTRPGGYYSTGTGLDPDGGASPFRKSFSDFESCASPTMRRAYSEAAALYSRSPASPRSGHCRSSPGRTPNRVIGGQSMMIFPIQEAPEHIRASFRKDSQDLSLTSFRKDGEEPSVAHVSRLDEVSELDHSSPKMEAGLIPATTATTTTGTTTGSMPDVKKAPDNFHRSTPLPSVNSCD